MEFLIITLLLVLNGVFALYEIALVSSSKSRLESMVAKGNKAARIVLEQSKDPEKYLSTIQIGITLIGIVSGAFGGAAIADDFEPFFSRMSWSQAYASQIAMVITVTLITYFSLVIGELVPKSMALSNPERYATIFCRLIVILSKISYPFVWLLSISTKAVNKIMGVSATDKPGMTEDELKMILHQSQEEGVLNKDETEMLKDVFRFNDKRANELMVSRPEIICLKLSQSKEEVLKTIQEYHFTRYPLIDKDKDDIIGIVSVKDIFLMQALCQQNNLHQKDKVNYQDSHIHLDPDTKFNLRDIAQTALYVPETIPATQVLSLFKQHKKKFGIVVNEYGSTEGIITLHDLSECIFGDIYEENETEEPDIIERKDGSLLVEASMNIDDFMEEMGISNIEDLKEEDFNTVGGLAMHKLGRVPVAGDTFTYQNLIFEVVDMDRGRVDKLLVCPQNGNCLNKVQTQDSQSIH